MRAVIEGLRGYQRRQVTGNVARAAVIYGNVSSAPERPGDTVTITADVGTHLQLTDGREFEGYQWRWTYTLRHQHRWKVTRIASKPTL